MKLLRIVLGILLPPVGVFLTTGISSAFFINILLTLLAWLPGSIHAVWVIVKHEERYV
ncbi:YqaE/Pmp3 family membrane protein [Coleofasciculus sp. G2-EDA-02]|uniref:YqaE/Pmp3 family membrane protein n=1 Tax=unclassified Coleofasciculus TaxID=2692782 RepID=UPI0032FD4F79